jgi:hypothetical protein
VARNYKHIYDLNELKIMPVKKLCGIILGFWDKSTCITAKRDRLAKELKEIQSSYDNHMERMANQAQIATTQIDLAVQDILRNDFVYLGHLEKVNNSCMFFLML